METNDLPCKKQLTDVLSILPTTHYIDYMSSYLKMLSVFC